MNANDVDLLDKLIESSKTKEKWDNDDRVALKKLRAKFGSPTQVAQALNVSAATLFRWEKSEAVKDRQLRPPPPTRHLMKLKELISAGHFASSPQSQGVDRSRVDLLDALMRVRTIQEVMEQSQFCSAYWIMRTGRPFAIASDPRILDYTITFMKAEQYAQIYFVYRDQIKGSKVDSRELQAKISFEAFWRQLHTRKENESIIKRIHSVPIFKEADANKLGFCDPWASFAMAEYNNEGYDKYGRSVNVWSEFIFETTQTSQIEQKKLVWLELPATEALMWRERRMPVLKQALQKFTSNHPRSKHP